MSAVQKMGDSNDRDNAKTPESWGAKGWVRKERLDALAAEVAALRADRDTLAETLRTALTRAETLDRLISEQTGSVVCWHEYDTIESIATCHQCSVAFLLDAIGRALAVPSAGYAIDDHGPKADAQTAHNAAVPSVDATADLSIDTDDNPAPWTHASGQDGKETDG